jgi:hypothetical protein
MCNVCISTNRRHCTPLQTRQLPATAPRRQHSDAEKREPLVRLGRAVAEKVSTSTCIVYYRDSNLSGYTSSAAMRCVRATRAKQASDVDQ